MTYVKGFRSFFGERRAKKVNYGDGNQCLPFSNITSSGTVPA
jgi:hypothetical protein